jgi:hypothetical protein
MGWSREFHRPGWRAAPLPLRSFANQVRPWLAMRQQLIVSLTAAASQIGARRHRANQAAQQGLFARGEQIKLRGGAAEGMVGTVQPAVDPGGCIEHLGVARLAQQQLHLLDQTLPCLHLLSRSPSCPLRNLARRVQLSWGVAERSRSSIMTWIGRPICPGGLHRPVKARQALAGPARVCAQLSLISTCHDSANLLARVLNSGFGTRYPDVAKAINAQVGW